MRLFAAVVIGMLWIGHVINLAKTFKDCIHNRKDYEAYQQIRERDSIFVPPITRVLLHNDCVLTWADENREVINAFSTVLIALFTFTLWRSTHSLWKAGDRQIEVARVSAKAAEAAVAESVKTLAHAREVADRDFRPWLTVNAKLTSQVGTQYSLEKGEITFFIELSCVNVGKMAARSVVYFVAGIDEVLSGDTDEWFDGLIEKAVKACWGDRDSLVPSEMHVSRRWCRVPGPQPGDFNERMRIARVTCRFRVGIVAAYRGAESDNRVFYIAKILPVGDPSMVEFFDIIFFEDLPVGIGDVAIGPVYMARAT